MSFDQTFFESKTELMLWSAGWEGGAEMNVLSRSKLSVLQLTESHSSQSTFC